MGSPAFAASVLEYLVIEGYELVLVVTPPDRVVGRGRKIAPTSLKLEAAALGLPILQTGSLKKAEVFEKLASLDPEVIIVAALGLLVPPNVLGLPRYGCINVHPSLLPRYRGASPITSAIMAGDRFSGVSIMLMDEGLDTGPILGQCQVTILSCDTAASLTGKLAALGARFLGDVLPRWARGEITPRPQDVAQATYTRMLTKGDGEIDWSMPAEAIWRMVRAYQPWPGAYTWWRGKRVKLLETLPVGGIGEIGKVVPVDRAGASFGVACGEGILAILKLQIEGGRVLSGAEFLRGQRHFVGEVLPS